jgi:hypothetical protein
MKHKLWRASVAAVVGAVGFLVAPAIAQAHHVNSKAKCVLEGDQPTLVLKAYFVGFESTHDVNGKVYVDGDKVFEGEVPATWDGDDGKWIYKRDATAGKSYKVVTKWWWGSNKDGETHYTNECPKPPPPPAHPAIALDKTGADTAAAGSTFTYSFKATNTGDVALDDVVLTDDKCQSTLTRTEPNSADATFDPGDEWFYTCTVIAPDGPAQVDNRAEVCGEYQPPAGDMQTVCDDDTHTFTVPPPATPPATPGTPVAPAAAPPASAPGTTPAGGGVLPETVVSGRAVLRGPSGCVKQAFRARVRGRSISAVTFFVDGRLVKRISGSRDVYRLKVRPNRFGFGRHKIVARVEFTAASGTPVRRLPLTFRRCAQGTVAPRFTG